ncbi:MAG: putative inner membrane protein [Candidatus Saccharicenans subterraneus]|uniref:Putative inner membrane protein n=1 Tax=Candidatus Saccharicenans subterraneus TaxID=2508984 RepID=A0A3E2BMK8_9BACT|nr:MAG: putative inner membrane protein [Candidatus Saccharicenans subterraneum]
MSQNRTYRLLSRLVDIRPEEVTPSLLMFFYFFLIQVSAYIIEPVKISLYLRWLTADRLPYAYLLSALLIGLAVAFNSELLQRIRRSYYLAFSLLFFISTLILFWFLFRIHWPWLSLIYWFWSDLFMVTTTTQFWIMVNDLYHPHQAKRLIGFLVSGGLLGGVSGALLASRLARHLGTENLLLICPVLLLFCLVIIYFYARLPGKEEKQSTASGARSSPLATWREIRSSRYLSLLAAIVALGMIITTLVDFQFVSVVGSRFTEQDARTSFLGSFLTVLLVFSYLLHVTMTTRILRQSGLRLALLIAPAFLLLSSLAIFFVPATYLIYWAVLIKGTDKSLSYSLNQSVRELLYVPVSPEIKYRAKVFIDMFVSKFAKGFSSIILLVGFTLLHFNLKQISLVTVAFIILWFMFNLEIAREYVNTVKKNLKIKWQDAHLVINEKIDLDLTKLVFDTLESKKRSSVLYAMNLMNLLKTEKLSPELKEIISYKADEVLARSMDSLLEPGGSVPVTELDRALEQEELGQDIEQVMALDVYREVMKEYIDKVSTDRSSKTETSRMEAAKALGLMEPDPVVIRNLKRLLRDESPDVAKYALESAARLKQREFVPLIIRHLGRAATREEARRTLASYGSRIIGTLKDYLSDREEDLNLRKAIPDILAQTGTQRAADLLSLELKKQDEEVEAEIIEALHRLRSRNSRIVFQKELILPEVVRQIKQSYFLIIKLNEFKEKKEGWLPFQDLEASLAMHLKRIFELLGLIYPTDEISRAYQNICQGTRKSLDYSIELLDNILPKELSLYLLPIIEDLPLEVRARRCQKLLRQLEKSMSELGPATGR